MFNKENGEIEIGNIIIRSSLKLDEFLLLPFAQEVVDKQSRGEHIALTLKPQWVGGTLFNIILYFTLTGRLFLISLRISHDGKLPSWENWSEDEERRLRGEHDRWLFQILGRPHQFGSYGEITYKFAWGGIESSYDPRSARSDIVIRYYSVATE